MNIYKTLRISNKTNEDVTHIVMNKIMIRQKWASCVVVEQIMLVRIWRKEYWIFNCLSPWNVQEQWECEWGDNILGQSCSWTVWPQTILGRTTQGLVIMMMIPTQYSILGWFQTEKVNVIVIEILCLLNWWSSERRSKIVDSNNTEILDDERQKKGMLKHWQPGLFQWG